MTTRIPLQIPGPRRGPFSSAAFDFEKAPLEYLTALQRTYGDVVCCRFRKGEEYMLFNPEHIAGFFREFRPQDARSKDAYIHFFNQTGFESEAILKETLRLRPVFESVTQILPRDYVVGGYLIPRGASLSVNAGVTHRDIRFYKNPAVFDPSRWSPEEEAKRPAGCYFPFGALLTPQLRSDSRSLLAR